MHDFDTVIIGSGAGGLTAAVALAQAGERVLVLEQHYVPGGWCHSFTIGGHRFSPGVHYVGELGEGGRMRRIFEGLGVAEHMEFLELNPDGYDHALIAGTRFDIPKGKERYVDRLKSRFPAEREGIDRYFGVVEKMSSELAGMIELDGEKREPGLGAFLRIPTVLRHGLFSLTSLFDRTGVRDPLLRAILGSQSGDHGLAPSDVPAAVHASVAAHYFDGGWYPRGGGFTIPRAFQRQLKRFGAELRTSAPVERILVVEEDGKKRAAGVRMASGETIFAKRVISNADPHVTFGKLVPREHQSWWLRRRLARAKYSVSSLSLFMATDLDVRSMGLDSGNYWWLDSTGLDEIYRLGDSVKSVAIDDFPGFFLTVTTLKDPSKFKGEHTMESFVFVPHAAFSAWASSKYGERPEDYSRMKQDLMGKMIRACSRVVPGLEKRITFAELGTPLTNEHYVAASRGNLYGTEKSRWHVGPFAWPLKTEISGLWMCGASTLGHGVLGAVMSGLVTAAASLRCPVRDLLTDRTSRVRLAPCEPAAPAPARPKRVDRSNTRSDRREHLSL